MTRLQVARLAVASLMVAAVQVAGFDRFLLFGVAYLALPLFVAVAVGGRLPFTNAALAGALVGVCWDLLGIDLFGRYALALALCSGISSIATFGAGRASRVAGTTRRALATATGFLVLMAVSALAGETLPPLNAATGVGLLLSTAIGTSASGSMLNRLILPTRTIWDPAQERSTEWMDRRAGLYTTPVAHDEREAA